MKFKYNVLIAKCKFCGNFFDKCLAVKGRFMGWSIIMKFNLNFFPYSAGSNKIILESLEQCFPNFVLQQILKIWQSYAKRWFFTTKWLKRFQMCREKNISFWVCHEIFWSWHCRPPRKVEKHCSRSVF